MNGVAIFFIVLLVLLVVAAVGWVVFTQLRARRLGVSKPQTVYLSSPALSYPATTERPRREERLLHAIRPSVHAAVSPIPQCPHTLLVAMR